MPVFDVFLTVFFKGGARNSKFHNFRLQAISIAQENACALQAQLYYE